MRLVFLKLNFENKEKEIISKKKTIIESAWTRDDEKND